MNAQRAISTRLPLSVLLGLSRLMAPVGRPEASLDGQAGTRLVKLGAGELCSTF